MSILTQSEAVAGYAAAVRDHLAALDPETLDELTGGLEADLTDALVDETGDPAALAGLDADALRARFGDPVAYAEELREAAGIDVPPAGPRPRRTLRRAVAEAGSAVASDWRHLTERNRGVRAVAGFAMAIRPAWWLLRAWVVFVIVRALAVQPPTVSSLGALLLLIALGVASVQWGRRAFGQGRRVRAVLLLVSIVSTVAILPTVAYAWAHAAQSGDGRYTDGWNNGYATGLATTTGDGVQVGGENATNLFVYGPDGAPIADARIVDQNGDPVVLGDPELGGSWSTWRGEWTSADVPVAATDPETPLNSYPYAFYAPDDLEPDEDGLLAPSSGALAIEPLWPVASLFPLVNAPAAEEPATDGAEAGGTTDPAETAEPGDAGDAGDPTDGASTDPTAPTTEATDPGQEAPPSATP